MKLTSILSLALFLVCSQPGHFANSGHPAGSAIVGDFPARTIFIKSPMASDPNLFFSTNKALMFEVYKVGSGSDLEKIIKAFRSDPAVESFNSGTLTGDYQAFVLILKTNKDKAWFISMFKKAGLNTIKLVHNDVIPVDKM